ncbi:MAG TPA: GWxTD domain-containing protein [Thermoanaerobaculia bacterium]|nr:GWxTD domain-containing protein [Thermoanaerobaculia bacterium]
MKPRLLTALLLLLAALTAAAAGQAIPKLSKKERAERLRLLPEEERRWLEDFVRPIILPDEENFFLLLSQPHEREIFKEEFWKRRERDGLAPPLGPGYRHRYEELLRIADQTYDGRREDAGMMVIAHGEPGSIETLDDCRDMFRDLEIWTYTEPSPGISGAKRYFFYRRSAGEARKLWTVADPESDVFQPGSCRKNFSDLSWDCRQSKDDPCQLGHFHLLSCSAACRVFGIYNEIRARQGSSLGGRTESATTLAPRTIPLEDLETLASRFPSIRNPQSRTIAIEGQATGSASSLETASTTPRRHLSFEQARERILRLDPKYREWLDMAIPLLSEEDLMSFLQMTEKEKDEFIRGFWRRRSR